MADASEITVTFPGGLRVEAHVGGHVVATDQPVAAGGEDAGPSPYSLFLASTAACAGFFALQFCRQRHLPTEGLHVRQWLEKQPDTGALAAIHLDIQPPAGFPPKYLDALLRSVDQCSVKRAIQAMPAFVVRATAAAVPAGQDRTAQPAPGA